MTTADLAVAHGVAAIDSGDASPDGAWDRFVAACPSGDIVQASVWAEAKCRVGYRRALAIHRVRDRIVGGASILMRRLGPFGHVGYVPRGPVVAPEADVDLRAVLKTVEGEARRHGIRLLIVQPARHPDGMPDALVARGFVDNVPEVAPSATLVLDLTQDLDTILRRMAVGRRRSVRQALSRGVSVRFGARSDLAAFHALSVATSKRQQFEPLALDHLLGQWDALRPAGAVQLVLAEHDGAILAGIVVNAFGTTVSFRHTGWSGERPDLQPNVACHWHAIQWAKQAGYTRYDFGGIDRGLALRIRAGESLLGDFQRSPAGYKAGFGGDVEIGPGACMQVVNPVLRGLARPALLHLGRRGYLDRIAQRARRASGESDGGGA